MRDAITIRLKHCVQLCLVWNTQQERRKWIPDKRTRNGVVERVDTQALCRVHVVAETGHVAEIASGLHGMSATAPGQVIQDLERAVTPNP